MFGERGKGHVLATGTTNCLETGVCGFHVCNAIEGVLQVTFRKRTLRLDDGRSVVTLQLG
jgi:hypothetical protein